MSTPALNLAQPTNQTELGSKVSENFKGWCRLKRNPKLFKHSDSNNFTRFLELEDRIPSLNHLEPNPPADTNEDSTHHPSVTCLEQLPKPDVVKQSGKKFKVSFMSEENKQSGKDTATMNITEFMAKPYEKEVHNALETIKRQEYSVQPEERNTSRKVKPIKVAEKTLIIPPTNLEPAAYSIKSKATKSVILSQRSLNVPKQNFGTIYKPTSDFSKLELAFFEKVLVDQAVLGEYLKSPFQIDPSILTPLKSELSISILEDHVPEIAGSKKVPYGVQLDPKKLSVPNRRVPQKSTNNKAGNSDLGTQKLPSLFKHEYSTPSTGKAFRISTEQKFLPTVATENSTVSVSSGSVRMRQQNHPKLQEIMKKCVAEAYYYPRTGRTVKLKQGTGTNKSEWLDKATADTISSSFDYIRTRREKGIQFEIELE